jgi:Tol biopolymer transport system component
MNTRKQARDETLRAVGSVLAVLALTAVWSCAPTDDEAEQDLAAGEQVAGEPVQADAEAMEAGEQSEGPLSFDPEEGETRIRNLRMLTLQGENAEAYFSADASQLIMQRHSQGEAACDQIYVMDVDGRNRRLVSTGEGRTTCSYFFPSGDRIVYSSTHASGPECPPPPDMSRGYVWGLYDYDIYTARPDGSELELLFGSPSYDAEATVSTDGSKIVFTSARDGDLDIYMMNPDGTDVRKLTDEVGYDGGPFFSADGSMIVYRAYHPTDPDEIADYQALLAENMIRPGRLEIYVMDADGSNKRQLTDNGAANFAPFFHPNGRQIIFSSNLHEPEGRNFELYLVNVDGTGLERVTHHPEFDGFPMFTPDGSQLVFGSNRHNRQPGDTNVFIADWVDEPSEN